MELSVPRVNTLVMDGASERPRRTWNDTVVRYLTDAEFKATLDPDKIHLRWLERFLQDRALAAIGREMIDRITNARRAGGVQNATVNRTLKCCEPFSADVSMRGSGLITRLVYECSASLGCGSDSSLEKMHSVCCPNCPSTAIVLRAFSWSGCTHVRRRSRSTCDHCKPVTFARRSPVAIENAGKGHKSVTAPKRKRLTSL